MYIIYRFYKNQTVKGFTLAIGSTGLTGVHIYMYIYIYIRVILTGKDMENNVILLAQSFISHETIDVFKWLLDQCSQLAHLPKHWVPLFVYSQ
jgi:hypothetical protein